MGNNKFAIGIDLGGTSVKYALIEENGRFHAQGSLPSKAEGSAEAVLSQILAGINEMLHFASANGHKVSGIGIGTPGIVDDAGVVLGGAENIWGWETVPLAGRIETETHLPVQVGNDANLMGLGETMYGAGKNVKNVVFITVGTGIGGAVIIDGKLFNGFANRRTELGHVPLMADGEPCACGSVGCLEHYASASALVRRFKERATSAGIPFPTDVDGKQIVALYKQGDALATMCLDEHCRFLGHGIGGFINIFSPQRVIIGGGLSEAGDFYIRKIRESTMRHCIDACAANTEIMAATLGNKGGSLGAAALCFPSL